MSHTWTFHPPGDKEDAPWRHYRCDDSLTTPSGLKIASVTQALSPLDKPALVTWAANVTTEGCWTLMRDPEYAVPRHWRGVQKELKARALDHNSTRDEAAFRGTTVHAIFEDFVNLGKVPNPLDYPVHWRGYIGAVVRWIMDMAKQGAEFEVAEVIVGSAEYGFAGTCDTVAVTESKTGKRVRWDLKTARQTYARTHFRQLAAYELAAVEMGMPPCDDMGIVVLHDDGTYAVSFSSEVEWNVPPAQSFLNVLAVWRDEAPLKAHEDATYKARVKAQRKAK